MIMIMIMIINFVRIAVSTQGRFTYRSSIKKNTIQLQHRVHSSNKFGRNSSIDRQIGRTLFVITQGLGGADPKV